MKLLIHLLIIFIVLFMVASTTNQTYQFIIGGGYTASFCFNSNDEFARLFYSNGILLTNCSKSFNNCTNGQLYFCYIPCGFHEKRFLFKTEFLSAGFQEIQKLKVFNKAPYYEQGQNLIINTVNSNFSLLLKNETRLLFSENISCSNITIKNHSVNCKLDLSKTKLNGSRKVNVTMSYNKCNKTQFVDSITIRDSMKNIKLYWIMVIFVVIFVLMLIFTSIFVIKNHKMKKLAIIALNQSIRELEKQEAMYSNAQKRAFLEYTTAIDSFTNLGKLTPRHLLSFYDYTSRIFNVELKTSQIKESVKDLKDFRSMLLNESTLFEWIHKMEKNCRAQERSLIASLLTLVLFQEPEYFLRIMKLLLINLVSQMKSNSEERILFRRSEAIVEKLVSNWISLCMYQNFESGEIGKRFFNLYRAIKCKMETGLIDFYTKKAKYALTYDHIMLSDLEYEVLNITATVQVELKLIESTLCPLQIILENINVDVLSLDCISQVKEKILDAAIMIYADKETTVENCEDINMAIAQIDTSDLKLFLVNQTAKIFLDDLDRTSIISTVDKESIIINTMKHYNLKSGMKFLLTTFSNVHNVCIIPFDKQYSTPKKEVHLQFPNDLKLLNHDKKPNSLDSNSKVPVNPIVENINKEAYLMVLLATKKSLMPFIDGFFQSITNYNVADQMMLSTNSIFLKFPQSQSIDPLLESSVNTNSQFFVANDFYLMPVYYLFSMFDDIAKSLSIDDDETVQLWKSNSFILRFWINLIKNPNFIFSVDKIAPMDESLTTIASVLMGSCSIGASNVNIDSPIIKQLFTEEVKGKYAQWWRSFINSPQVVETADMIAIMNEIIEKNQMSRHYNSSLRSLQTITDTLPIKLSMFNSENKN